MDKLEQQYTVREISFKLYGEEPAKTATEPNVIKTLTYLKNLINQPTDYPRLKAYRNDISNKEWYKGQRRARLGKYMSEVRKAETHINFENSEFLKQDLFVVKENESETCINRKDFIDLLKTDNFLGKLYSLNPFWEDIAKPVAPKNLKDKRPIVGKSPKDMTETEVIPSKVDIKKLKNRIRKDQFFKDRKELYKLILYRINKAVSTNTITFTKGKPPTFSIELPDGLLGNIIDTEIGMALSGEFDSEHKIDRPSQNRLESDLGMSIELTDKVNQQLEDAAKVSFLFHDKKDDQELLIIHR